MTIEAPIPIPQGPAVPNSGTPEITFDAQYEAFNEWERNELAPKANALAQNVYANAQFVEQAAQQVGLDKQSAHEDAERLAALDALWLGPHDADPTTGRNGVQLVEGNAYVNTKTGYLRAYNGEDWVQGLSAVAGVLSLGGQTGDLSIKTVGGHSILGTGDVPFKNSYGPGEYYTGLLQPDEGTWLAANLIYLKSSYPALAAALPVIAKDFVFSSREIVASESMRGFSPSTSYAKPVTHKGFVYFLGTVDGATKVAKISPDGNNAVVADLTAATGLSSIYSIAASPTQLAVLGRDSNLRCRCAYSEDGGATWILSSNLLPNTTPDWLHLVWDGVQWVVISSTGTGYACRASSHAAAWAACNLSAASYSWSAPCTNGKGQTVVFAGSQVATLTTGTWTYSTQSVITSVSRCLWDEKTERFTAFHGDTNPAIVSTNAQGTAWASSTATYFGRRKQAVANGIVFAVANGGLYYANTLTSPATSVTLAGNHLEVGAVDGAVFIVDSDAAGALPKIHKIDTYGYDRTTQFYVPSMPWVVSPFNQWVRAV